MPPFDHRAATQATGTRGRGPRAPRGQHALVVLALAALLLGCTPCHSRSSSVAPEAIWLEAPGTRFVSPGGDDAGPGTQQRPWRTIQAAVNRLEPGDVLVLADGTWRESVHLSVSGTRERPVVIRARTPGAAVIDAQGAVAIGDDGDGLAHVALNGLTVRNASVGFDLTGSVRSVTLAHTRILDCSHAFLCRQGSDLRLTEVTAVNCRDGIGIGVKGRSGVTGLEIAGCHALLDRDAEGGGNTDGFRVEGLCTEVTLSRCEAAGFDDSGFDVKPDGAVIERCLAHHNWDNGFKLWGRGARLINCIARDNHDTGVTITNALGLYHCTIAFNRRAALRPQADDIRTIVVRNCIIAHNFVRQYQAKGGAGVYDDDYNLYWADDDETIWKVMDGEGETYTIADLRAGALPMGAHSLFAAPAFVDPQSRDLRPRADSPAVGAAMPLAFVPLDFAGAPRTTPADIGALQH